MQLIGRQRAGGGKSLRIEGFVSGPDVGNLLWNLFGWVGIGLIRRSDEFLTT